MAKVIPSHVVEFIPAPRYLISEHPFNASDLQDGRRRYLLLESQVKRILIWREDGIDLLTPLPIPNF
jgi:hypothetical protein